MKKNRTKRILSMLLTLCMVLTLVPMTAFAADTYTLTIVNGTKSEGGETVVFCEAGSAFNITANEAPTGKVFDKWESTVPGVPAGNGNSTTWFTMPAQDVTVTATYKNNPETDTELKVITVNAYKSGWQNPALTPAFDRETRSYSLNLTAEYNSIYFYLPVQVEGQTIIATVDENALAVNTAAGGFETAQHTLTKAKTVFVFTITAKDKSTTGTYTVTVNRGSGITNAVTVKGGTTATPTPADGDTVTITANEPAPGTVFDKWTTTDGVTFANAKNATTTFVMPTKAVTVTATYKNNPETDTELSNIKVNAYKSGWQNPALTPAFDRETRSYALNLTSEYDSIYFYLGKQVEGQTITATVDGNALAVNTALNGFETAQHTLTKATTVFVFTVTAKDSITTDTYTVTVNRLAATVDSIAVNSTTHKTVYKVGEALDVSNLTIVANMSDSSTQTINVTSAMVTGFGSSAVAASQTLTITYEGKTTTYTISIGKADGPAAPTGLVGVKPTTVGGSDGKITGTTNLMEYADNAAFTGATDCSGTEITGLSADTYYVRIKETATHKAGAAATVTVPAGSTATVTSITVNSTSHKTAYKVGDALDVSNLTIEATMSDSTTQTINVTSDMVTGFDSSAVSASQTLTITYNSKSTIYNISIDKADGPAAPTGIAGVKPTTLGGSDGKITGTTSLMEYATDSAFSSPTDCTGTEITGLSAGTYYVRVKETATHKAGAYATVTVPAGSTATYTVTVSSGGTSATGSGSYTAGTTINIYAGSRSGYTFTGWTSSDVTITNASSKNASFTMPAKNVTVTANWSYNSGGGGGGGSSSNTNATLSDSKVEFDKNEGDDLKVTLKSGSYNLRSIKNGSYTLREGKDYTISGRIVTIKVSYLDSLEEGKHSLTFDMNGGTDPVLTIIVTDTTETDPQEEKPPVEETVNFEDVKSSDWFYDAVNYVYNAGLMKGNSDTTFGPYADTTRGMIVTILHRLEGKPKANIANDFTDVGADKYFTDAVAWASENKIVSGYGNDIFGPENSITREQLAVILMNYAKYKGYDVSMRTDLSEFADGEHISTWAKDPMSWANAEGLIQGSQNQLMPKGNAQRSQVAAILQRFLETIAK